MKANWSCTCGGGGHVEFKRTNKCLSGGKDLSALFTYAVARTLKFNKNYKDKVKENSNLDYESVNFNF